MTFLSCVLDYNGLVPHWLTSSAQQSPPPPAWPITRGRKLTKVGTERLSNRPRLDATEDEVEARPGRGSQETKLQPSDVPAPGR